MAKTKSKILLTRDDYGIIKMNLKNGMAQTMFNRKEAEELEAELRRAKIVDEKNIPEDVIRLNSLVTVKDENEGKTMQLMIVIPQKADIKQKKISVMSPIGTALIGYRKGTTVSWRVPAGKKNFIIVDVSNSIYQE